MFGIGAAVKWGSIGIIAIALIAGVKWGYEYHLDQIDAAINTAKLEFAIEKQEAVSRREEILREEARREKEAIEIRLKAERAKVNDLQRMLLIDHDLNRLLQRKPGLILTRVNEGTETVLKELEEITQ